MNTTKEIPILKAERGVVTEKMDVVAAEHVLHIHVNGRHLVELACTPQHLEELALGHLYSAGMIGGLCDVKQLTTAPDFRTIRATAECGDVPLSRVPDGPCIPQADILFNMEQFLRKSTMFFDTGAMHACALVVDGQILYFMEDIGRHNALDKVIGAALRGKSKENPLENAVILTSGRVPSDVMTKIIRSRAPIVVSRSAPTDAAVELALRYNVTLCGFAKGDRFNIYAGKSRVMF